MNKTMRLTVRMALGFGVLVLLLLVLGIIGVVGMKELGGCPRFWRRRTSRKSPANDIERHALSMVPSLRAITATRTTRLFDGSAHQLGEVKKFLAEAGRWETVPLIWASLRKRRCWAKNGAGF